MHASNQAAYNATVLGVAKFAGKGVVFQNARPHVTAPDGSYEGGQINIDVGPGWVSCLASSSKDFTGIRRGDNVFVSGSVGGALNWEAEKALLNEIPAAPGVKWRAGYEYLPKNSITLLTGTCQVEKVR